MLSERADGALKGHPFLPARRIPYKGQGKRKELLMNQPSLRYRQLKKTPDERPVRHPGGNYGYTCSSLTTQIFRFGGCSWPIHRIRTPEPYRASAWDESGVFCCRENRPGAFAPGLFHVKQFLVSEKEGQ